MSRHLRTFASRLDDFPRVAAFIEEAAAEAGFARDDCLRLTLVVEELFSNTVMHGQGDGAPVRVGLEASPGRIAVSYEDTGPRFDPMAGTDEALDRSVDLDDRPLGGLGLVLVRRLGRDVRYSHTEGTNHISLVLLASPH